MALSKVTKSLLALCVYSALGACALTPVQPYEKGNLAKPIMALDPDPHETRYTLHTYTSKEAASGGYGVGGGGCGCN